MEDYIYKIENIAGPTMYVFEDRLIFEETKALGKAWQGYLGKKTVYFSDISYVKFKNCGILPGYFEFTFNGGIQMGEKLATGAGFMSASRSNNPNKFEFQSKPTHKLMKQRAAEIEEINEFIQRKIGEHKGGRVVQQQNISAADELMKLKSLLDQGVISQEEFDLAKSKLL